MSSELALYDLASGEVRTVLHTETLIEAPNWTADGQSLIINGEGRLYRVDLREPRMVAIDTGELKALNNDHGISPDGRLLVVSDSPVRGQSRIYTLPLGGGTPRLVQGLTPSYWHGWSPDGERLAYVAKRDNAFQIYTCGPEGGPETQVTHGFDHADGPDYTPDAQWLWFNGEKGGSVQLWRVRSSGLDLQQMTDDERVNWFPHPSPDGQHVLYLAYENGVQGHPRHHEVQLRLLPAAGGKPRVLLALFGGQGSLNVPCWAPDSRQFAFVRYSRPPECQTA